jgi:hypothetical protein
MEHVCLLENAVFIYVRYAQTSFRLISYSIDNLPEIFLGGVMGCGFGGLQAGFPFNPKAVVRLAVFDPLPSNPHPIIQKYHPSMN